MKPLTIEQLKSLPVGEWVWIKDKYCCEFTTYYRIELFINDGIILSGMLIRKLNLMLSTYGTRWVAYKNKEQAEAKGEIVELPCKVGDTVYAILEVNYKLEIIQYTANKIVAGLFDKIYYDPTISHPHRFEFGRDVFADKSEAEAKLAKIRGAQS